MAVDEDDYVFFGTPLLDIDEVKPRNRKEALDKGEVKNLPVWKQEATDSEGRKRFHGAFTGGFSAGYFNTVGSKEGWAPSSFTSSRSQRAEKKSISAIDFMDEDEKLELESKSWTTNPKFDSLGFTSAEVARRQVAEGEASKHPEPIPGLNLEDVFAPVNHTIGMQLLHKMGFRLNAKEKEKRGVEREGEKYENKKNFSFQSSSKRKDMDENESKRSNADKRIGAIHLPHHFQGERERERKDGDEKEVRKEVNKQEWSEPMSFFQKLSKFILSPKNDAFGLGFDPFENAPEFRDYSKKRKENFFSNGQANDYGDEETNFLLSLNKEEDQGLSSLGKRMKEERSRMNQNGNSQSLVPFSLSNNQKKVRMAKGFGIGAMEDMDDEDEDVYDAGYSNVCFEEEEEEEIESFTNDRNSKISKMGNSKPKIPFSSSHSSHSHVFKPTNKKKFENGMEGFVCATVLPSNNDLEWYVPPIIPSSFVPMHTFSREISQKSLPSVNETTETSFLPPPPPSNAALKSAIEGMAAFAAFCGKDFENVARQKNISNPLFAFLNDGEGADYYSYLLKERRKEKETKGKEREEKEVKHEERKEKREQMVLTHEERGRLLGEGNEEGMKKESIFKFISKEDKDKLKNVFGKQFVSQNEQSTESFSSPFLHDPEKQKRFQNFLHEREKGGLRKGRGHAQHMGESASKNFSTFPTSERERMHEWDDFENAARQLERMNGGKTPSEKEEGGNNAAKTQLLGSQSTLFAEWMGNKFVSGGLQQTTPLSESALAIKEEEVRYPFREEEEWRPSPLLCKRFDVADPFWGRKKAPSPSKADTKFPSLSFFSNLPSLNEKSTRNEKQEEEEQRGEERKGEGSKTIEMDLDRKKEKQKDGGGKKEIDKEGEEEEEEVSFEEMKKMQVDEGKDDILSAVEKPIDIFKAIFEDEDFENEEDEKHPDAADEEENEFALERRKRKGEVSVMEDHQNEFMSDRIQRQGRAEELKDKKGMAMQEGVKCMDAGEREKNVELLNIFDDICMENGEEEEEEREAKDDQKENKQKEDMKMPFSSIFNMKNKHSGERKGESDVGSKLKAEKDSDLSSSSSESGSEEERRREKRNRKEKRKEEKRKRKEKRDKEKRHRESRRRRRSREMDSSSEEESEGGHRDRKKHKSKKNKHGKRKKSDRDKK